MRNGHQFQACFVRQAVALALVYFFGRPNQVFPGVPAAARAGHDVVQAALLRAQEAAGVLAPVAIALADCPGAELRALLGHLGEVDRHDHGRQADCAAHGMHYLILVTDGERDPLLPGYGTDAVPALNLQRGGDIGGHHAECLLRGAYVDWLPVAVQHQHGRFGQSAAHTVFAHGHRASRIEVFVLCWGLCPENGCPACFCSKVLAHGHRRFQRPARS